MATIKKIILLALTALIMVGCSENRTQPIDQPIELDRSRIYVIDSCEYVGWCIGFRAGVLAHKGNCRFCAERRKQELESLVEQLKEK